jgi:hypothetical protein
VKTELVSGRIRTAVREKLVGSTLGEIGDLFGSEGLTADLDYEPQVGGQRRTYVEQFYVRIDWTNWDHVRRFLRVVEGVLGIYRAQEVNGPTYEDSIAHARIQLEQLLARDGLVIDENGSIRPKWEVITQQTIQALPDESAIPGHLQRMWNAVEERPEQAIGAAKDAIEATTKHALDALSVERTGREDLQELIRTTQSSLKLHPTTVAPDAKGAEPIIKALGALATIAVKVDELRNLYGDGHGQPKRIAGLSPRHARLVARCADAYVGMILDTLDDPRAPWKKAHTAA